MSLGVQIWKKKIKKRTGVVVSGDAVPPAEKRPQTQKKKKRFVNSVSPAFASKTRRALRSRPTIWHCLRACATVLLEEGDGNPSQWAHAHIHSGGRGKRSLSYTPTCACAAEISSTSQRNSVTTEPHTHYYIALTSIHCLQPNPNPKLTLTFTSSC